MKKIKDKLNLKKIIAAVVGLAIFAAVLIYAGDIHKEPLFSSEGQSYEKATVTEVVKDNLQEDGNRYGDQDVRLEIKSGQLAGTEVSANSPSGSLFGANCTVGMKVIAIVSTNGEDSVVTVYAQDRTFAIYMFILFFIIVVCLIGGAKGVKAIASLIFTGVSIMYILFPLIYRGWSPIPVTIGICILATLFTLLLIGGFTKKTASAVIGTTCGVTVAGISAIVFGHFAGISGFNVSDIETLNYVAEYTPIKIGELLFSGIIISSLGAVMDVGMSMASTIQELHETDPTMGRKRLFMSGIHIGRDMMGTMTNTLILAYVGGSLTTLVINYAYDLTYNQLMNSYIIGIEIMQGIAGSLGVVLAVPITAVVAVELIYRQKRSRSM